MLETLLVATYVTGLLLTVVDVLVRLDIDTPVEWMLNGVLALVWPLYLIFLAAVDVYTGSDSNAPAVVCTILSYVFILLLGGLLL